jgi:aspartate/methionine/tyrosine aminotransferase
MKELTYNAVVEANNADLTRSIEGALSDLEKAQCTYPKAILRAIDAGFVSKQIQFATDEINSDFLSNPKSKSAGAYFANENVLGGSRVDDSVRNVNTLGENYVPQWITDPIKKKIGPGIGYIKTPRVYEDLLTIGLNNPEYSLNYTAPFGNKETRVGIKKLMDARVDPEKNIFSENGVFLTDGATEGIDLFFDALATLSPEADVVFLGLSYYTGPFAAEQKNLSINRIIANPSNTKGEVKFLPTASEIRRSASPKTKALVLTIPNNPNGESYSDQEMINIVKLVKEKGWVVLFDAIFENMSFNESRNFRSRLLQIAYEAGAIDQFVTVDSLSKTKNIPGERIGYMATTNEQIASSLMKSTMARRCNPRLTVGPIMLFEGIARSVKAMQMNAPSLSLMNAISKALEGTSYFTKDTFLPLYTQWDAWNNQALQYYKDNLEIVRALLDKSVAGWSPDTAAYNTLVKFKDIQAGTNNMDYLAKLMFTTATYTQVGPCFGLSQRIWDTQLGVWTRITYACERNDLIEALKRLIVFSQIYAEKDFGNPKKFEVLNIRYDNQI